MAYLATLSLALAGLLLYVLRQSAVREREWALERGALLQRIQAPEIAVAQHEQPKREPIPAVGFEDDEGFHEAKKRAMSNGNDH